MAISFKVNSVNFTSIGVRDDIYLRVGSVLLIPQQAHCILNWIPTLVNKDNIMYSAQYDL